MSSPSVGRPIPDAQVLCLPDGYRQRRVNQTLDLNRAAAGASDTYWTQQRADASVVYQHHVYAWGASLLKSRRQPSVLDVGCGTGAKLKSLMASHAAHIEGLDQPNARQWFERMGPPAATFKDADLESPGEAWKRFDLILCADVLEHLADPRPAMRLMRDSCHSSTALLLSTPDRARLRGRSCMTSDKPDHVREWTADEFRKFVRAQGFRVLRRRFLPQDEAPLSDGSGTDRDWRMRIAEKSPWACCALLCERARK